MAQNSSSRLKKSYKSVRTDLDSTLKMNSESPGANLRIPEKMMCAPQAPSDHLDHMHLSSELTASRMPNIKLDLDLPECEAEEIDEIEPIEILNDLNLENVESDERSFGDTSLRLESVYLDDYLLDKTLSETNEIKIELGSDIKFYNAADNLQIFDTPTFDITNVTDSDGAHNHSINRRFTFEGMQMQKFPVTEGTYFTEDPNWYEKNFPSLEQSHILKTASEPDNRVQEGYEAYDETNSSRSSSPPAKQSRTASRFENATFYTLALDLDAKVSGSEIKSQVLSCELPHPECIHYFQMAEPVMECTWISGSMPMNVRRSTEYPDASVLANELAQRVMTICCDNGIPVAILGEKLTYLP